MCIKLLHPTAQEFEGFEKLVVLGVMQTFWICSLTI